MKAFSRHLLVILVLLTLLPGCGTKKADDSVAAGQSEPGRGIKVDGAKLAELITDNTIIMQEYGEKATIEMYGNGKLYAVKSANEKNDGWWSIEGDQLCIKFKRWGYGEEACYDAYQKGGRYDLYSKTGLKSSSFTVEEGVKHAAANSKKSSKRKKRKVAAAAPDVVMEEEVEAPTASAPAIQESTQKSYNPQEARRDLRMIYRGMSQNCPGCNLANVDMAGASLMRANLAGANLVNSNFNNANLKWANLKGANLSGADLSGANLAGADLAGANLERADLTDANLEQTNLRGALIDRAIGLNLRGAIR